MVNNRTQTSDEIPTHKLRCYCIAINQNVCVANNVDRIKSARVRTINPLNAELNHICHLLALLGTHHILYVSRIRVKNPASYI